MHVVLWLICIVSLFVVACSGPDNDDGAVVQTPTPPDATATQPVAPPATPPLPTLTPTASATATPTAPPTPTRTPTAVPSPTPSPTATPDPVPFEISAVALNDIDDTPLQYLSLAAHPFLDGSIRVHGTISLSGVGQPAEVVLEVVRDEEVIATGTLTEQASALLLRSFGEVGALSVSFSQPLFVIAPDQLAALDTTFAEDRELSLRVRASATDGREVVVDAVSVQQLVRYTNDNRYFVGEDEQGGNDWVLPSVRALLERFDGVQLGDISNMHGGSFPPHVTHQQGRDADLWFPGYNELDNIAAQTLLGIIDRPELVERIELIYVTYSKDSSDSFWTAIEDVVLTDGRFAADVILPEPDHTGHFHVRCFGDG